MNFRNVLFSGYMSVQILLLLLFLLVHLKRVIDRLQGKHTQDLFFISFFFYTDSTYLYTMDKSREKFGGMSRQTQERNICGPSAFDAFVRQAEQINGKDTGTALTHGVETGFARILA